ncbi:hypothetical protein Y032_0048g1555 [Ancylostoma ceylanicum]|uniref:Uncharacterized protein n=1 Tax=Ancylostoma ceylanicum TaxID=53326 RepID=A0A016UBL8_9BILA|nr:hypothetical protein Y032_0048g1555 [Ancylostoma ceylanicum]
MIKRKYCVYYEEYRTEECNATAEGKFGALSTIDEISGKCTAYHHTKDSHVVVACFCRTDGCNSMDSVISLARNSRHNPERLPSIPDMWHVNPSFSAKKRREILSCLANKRKKHHRDVSQLKITKELASLVAVVAIPIVLFCILSTYLHIFSTARGAHKSLERGFIRSPNSDS